MKCLKYYFPLLLAMIVQLSAPAQHVGERLTGKVVAAGTGMPIAGAVISLRSNKNQTATNNNGDFAITLYAGKDTLVITHISYEEKKVAVNQATGYLAAITLNEAAKQLNEVVLNTGFQTIPRERATGSFTYVDNKTLNLQTGMTILDRLNGVASGILFDDSKTTGAQKKLNFNVRGLSTINGPQDPLIIVDNFPYDGDISNIDPGMIESITILKDAAASSIWGTRAGNGVIVITTRHGHFQQPLKIEFNANMRVANKPDLFYLPQISSSDYTDVEEMLYNQGYFNSAINDGYSSLTPVADILYRKDNGLLSPAEATSQIDALRNHDVRNDYGKYFYRNAVNQQYGLNLYGGGEKISYIVSAGLDKNIDNLNAGYNRLNVRTENSYKPIKNMLLTTAITYTDSRSVSGRPAYNDILSANRYVPYLQFADASGAPVAVAQSYRDEYTDTAGAGKLLSWKYYPLEDYRHNTARTALRNMLADVGVQYQIIPGLTADIKYQYERQEFTGRTLEDTGSYAARSMINLYSEIDGSGKVNYLLPRGSILNSSATYTESNNIREQLSFTQSWHKHAVSAILGSETRQVKSNTNTNTVYGYNDDLLIASNVDFLNAYPSYVTGYTSYIPSGLSFSETDNRFVSFYGNAGYTYNGKYTFSASGRRDASNLFGVNINDKWKPFWSAGGAWNVSKENFYRLSFLPYFRLRATYGVSGNVDQTKSAVTVMQYIGTNSASNLPYGIVTQYANPNLSWEKVKILNIAIDFASRNQAISGSIEYYHKTAANLFGPSPLDYTAGLNRVSVIRNVADMTARGIDINLQTVNINRVLQWKTGFLISYYADKTTGYYATSGFIYRPGYGTNISPVVGKPLYSILSYNMAGLDPQTGDPLGYLGKQVSKNYNAIVNSVTSIDSLLYNGPATPRLYGAVRNTLAWKGLSLDVNIVFKAAYYFRKPSIDYSTLFASGNGNADFSKRWQTPGDEKNTNVPSMVYPDVSQRDNFYLLSQNTVDRADHVRLQFVNLSYDLSNILPAEYFFKSLQLYINAANLGILWRANKDGLDPEYTSSIPPSKTYTIGFRTNF